MILETTRLQMRAFEVRDAEAFAAMRQDPEVARYQSWEPDFSYSQARDFISELQKAKLGTAGEWYQIAIADKRSDEFLGDIGVFFDEEGKGEVTLGYTMSSAAQGNGYATESMDALLDYLSENFSAVKASALTDVLNLPSQRLLEKLGFASIKTIEKSKNT